MAAMQLAILEAAYRRTIYHVQTPGGPMPLRIGERSSQLQAVHARLGVRESVFMTAWNPQSVLQCAPRNAVAQARLDHRLAQLGLTVWPGSARDPEESWPAEQSRFVAGLDLDAARRLAAEFGQYALVHAALDAVPRLVWVSPPAGSDPPAAPGTATSGS
jgi:hypothetical protein